MIKKYFVQLFFFFFLVFEATGQEIERFTTSDFYLRGNVKSCQVITDYGKEVFEFDQLGRLLQVTTEYNENDRDVTSYKYGNGELIEKRSESYKDNALDVSSSMAYFYSVDSTDHKMIKEEIISYDKEFLETQRYHFDDKNQLERIVVSHQNAVDEITITKASYKNEVTTTYFENGIIQKSIRESVGKSTGGKSPKITLTKVYLDGEPNKATEERYDTQNKLVSREMFMYDAAQTQFVTQEKNTYSYSAEGFLSKEIIKRGNAVSEKQYIYQFDDAPVKNWVKKITTPDNTYTTRKIEYYPAESTSENPPE